MGWRLAGAPARSARACVKQALENSAYRFHNAQTELHEVHTSVAKRDPVPLTAPLAVHWWAGHRRLSADARTYKAGDSAASI